MFKVNELTIGIPQTDTLLVPVDELSFTLFPGETVALLGESGCGKSLTALSLIRLLPDMMRYGFRSAVNLDKTDLLQLPESLMRQLRGRRIAIIFQEPMMALNPVLTIGQQLSEAISSHQSLSKKSIFDQQIALLTKVEITDAAKRLKHYPHQLSGGQKQRVMIAMALANNPEILIADEPTTALDVTVQYQILILLKRLQREYGMSILLITHDLGVVKASADRVCVMYAGQLVEQGPVDAFFQQLKHPYSQQLLASLPHPDYRGFHLPVIPGNVPKLSDLPQGCRFHPRCIYAFDRCQVETPAIQTVDCQQVRCHLYPQINTLPKIPKQSIAWNSLNTDITPLLSIHDLSIFFRSGHLLTQNVIDFYAVNDLSLTINKAQTVALVGESGSGKTTVSRAILKLQPINTGQILFENNDIEQFSSRQLKQYRRDVQIIFQDPYASMNPRMTIEQIIAEGMVAQGFAKAQIQKKLVRLLDQVNLPRNSLTRYPHQFSGGQRQRICIARALATEPKLLVCDEPTSALDVSVQAQILNLLKELQQELGVAYLFITHNMNVVSYLAHHVVVMQAGKVVESGNYEAVFHTPQQEYTKKLLASVLTVENL